MGLKDQRSSIPLYEETDRIARRIHEKALEEAGKIYSRRPRKGVSALRKTQEKQR